MRFNWKLSLQKCMLFTPTSTRFTKVKSFSSATSQTSGLFGSQGLNVAADFNDLSYRASKRVSQLLQVIENIPVDSNPRLLMYLLDSLSYELCAVVDVAELCRNIHVDQAFCVSADNAFNSVAQLIHKLNTNEKIYFIITHILNHHYSNLSDEEKVFLIDMKHEYESEGIHLPTHYKQILIDVQKQIIQIEATYLQNVANDHHIFELGPISKQTITPLREWLYSQIPQLKSIKTPHNDYLICTSNKRYALSLLKSLPNEANRRDLWYYIWFQPYENMEQLGLLIQQRQKLAYTLNKESYAHKFLLKQAIKKPESIQHHLENLSQKTRKQAEMDILQLTKLKYSLSSDVSNTELSPWDISYYTAMYTSIQKEFKKEPVGGSGTLRSEKQQVQNLSCYFSLKCCMEGILMISKELFNIEFIQVPLDSFEDWTSVNSSSSASASISSFFSFNSSKSSHTDSLQTGIYKFEVYDHSSSYREKIGIVYIDLFQRHGKFPGSAMFTVQCGCKKSIHEHIQSTTSTTTTQSSGQYISDLHLNRLQEVNIDNVNYEIPRVTLVMNFTKPSTSSKFQSTSTHGPLLSLQDLETLYHEWGHMLHSLLSRTSFQHLSGTRTSMDFSEVPSHLFEYFARTPSVIQQWARHYQTDASVPLELIEEVLIRRYDLSTIDLQSQILFTAADQYLFGSQLPDYQNTSPQEIFWRSIPPICHLQEQLTSLPFATHPSNHFQRLRYMSLSDGDISQMDIVKRSCDYYNIQKLPYFMLGTHSHFVNYGAGYYSYLYARMYAAQIWYTRFASNPLSRESGNILRHHMLRYGASKDAQSILDDMAGGPLDPSYFLQSYQS